MKQLRRPRPQVDTTMGLRVIGLTGLLRGFADAFGVYLGTRDLAVPADLSRFDSYSCSGSLKRANLPNAPSKIDTRCHHSDEQDKAENKTGCRHVALLLDSTPGMALSEWQIAIKA